MIAKALFRLMAEREWDQTKLAQESGVPQATISAILTRRTTNPKIGSLQKLADALGVDISVFQVPVERSSEREGSKPQDFFRAEHVPDHMKQTIQEIIEFYRKKAEKKAKTGDQE